MDTFLSPIFKNTKNDVKCKNLYVCVYIYIYIYILKFKEVKIFTIFFRNLKKVLQLQDKSLFWEKKKSFRYIYKTRENRMNKK